MNVKQFVMAYSADHDNIRSLLPKGYRSLRPVLRINIEVIDELIRVEFNTPIEHLGRRGWLNLITWENQQEAIDAWKKEYDQRKNFSDIRETDEGHASRFSVALEGEEFLSITYARAGVQGGCPKEDDNEGTYTLGQPGETTLYHDVELIDGMKEYCDCTFNWTVPQASLGDKDEWIKAYMAIPEEKVLGAYVVEFQREAIPEKEYESTSI